MKIYVASSWRNRQQPKVVEALKSAGHDVYDFRNADTAFRWSDVSLGWHNFDADRMQEALGHEIVQEAFSNDLEALNNCDMCVYVMPCGVSASIEMGYAVGRGKPVVVLLSNDPAHSIKNAEVMLLMADKVCASLEEMMSWVHQLDEDFREAKGRFFRFGMKFPESPGYAGNVGIGSDAGTVPNPSTPEEAWAQAKQSMIHEGIDVEELLQKAGENITKLRVAPNETAPEEVAKDPKLQVLFEYIVQNWRHDTEDLPQWASLQQERPDVLIALGRAQYAAQRSDTRLDIMAELVVGQGYAAEYTLHRVFEDNSNNDLIHFVEPIAWSDKFTQDTKADLLSRLAQHVEDSDLLEKILNSVQWMDVPLQISVTLKKSEKDRQK